MLLVTINLHVCVTYHGIILSTMVVAPSSFGEQYILGNHGYLFLYPDLHYIVIITQQRLTVLLALIPGSQTFNIISQRNG